LKLRLSTDSDLPAISRIHLDAFGPAEGPEIVDLVSALLSDETAVPYLSIVAESGGELTGHVLFSAARLDSPGESPVASILAPLGVLQASQLQGVGSLLVNRGLELLIEQGVDLVFVLGHPAYYPRFGFEPAGRFGFEAPYPIPEKNAEAWMVKALKSGALELFAGTVACAAVLNRPEHWRE
jgi:predicted N-acetyltransferase YhbS